MEMRVLIPSRLTPSALRQRLTAIPAMTLSSSTRRYRRSLTVNGGGDEGDWLIVQRHGRQRLCDYYRRLRYWHRRGHQLHTTNLAVNGVSGFDTFQISSTSSGITRVNGGLRGNNYFQRPG